MRSLPQHILRAVSVESGADPKSVQRVVSGEPTRALTRTRIVAALEKMGLGAWVPPDSFDVRPPRRH